MPTVTRYFLKTALVFFVTALALGLAVAARPVLALPGYVSALTPVYFHLFMVGWVTELIFGVALWMFPKHSREKPRGHEPVAWATYWLLNGGLLLRMVGEPVRAVSAAPVWGWLLVFSALLQWSAGVGFVTQIWPRVKGR